MVSSPSPTSADAPSAAVGGAALEADQLELVRLVGQLGAGLVVGDHAAREGLALVDDPLHDLLELLEVIGGERVLDVEVVVEAVADRRPDAEPGLGVDLLHRLGEHVRGGVPQDGQAVLGVDGHRLDDVAVGEDVGQVAQLAVDAGDDARPCRPRTGQRPSCPPRPIARFRRRTR